MQMQKIIAKNRNESEDIMAPPGKPAYTDTYVHLASHRVIVLNEIITKQTATDLSALLLHYDSESCCEPIDLYINSNGGDAYALTNIYDMMRIVRCPIRTICMGKCYSAAAVILSAGYPGQRFMFKHSKVMIHGIQAGFPIPGHDMTNSKNYYKFLKDNNDNIMKMLAEHTGKPLEQIKTDCKEDLWLNAKEAVAYGIADHII